MLLRENFIICLNYWLHWSRYFWEKNSLHWTKSRRIMFRNPNKEYYASRILLQIKYFRSMFCNDLLHHQYCQLSEWHLFLGLSFCDAKNRCRSDFNGNRNLREELLSSWNYTMDGFTFGPWNLMKENY